VVGLGVRDELRVGGDDLVRGRDEGVVVGRDGLGPDLGRQRLGHGHAREELDPRPQAEVVPDVRGGEREEQREVLAVRDLAHRHGHTRVGRAAADDRHLGVERERVGLDRAVRRVGDAVLGGTQPGGGPHHAVREQARVLGGVRLVDRRGDVLEDRLHRVVVEDRPAAVGGLLGLRRGQLLRLVRAGREGADREQRGED
jgi:hypothetical protein